MRISDWSSDVCSSDLGVHHRRPDLQRSRDLVAVRHPGLDRADPARHPAAVLRAAHPRASTIRGRHAVNAHSARISRHAAADQVAGMRAPAVAMIRSEKQTSELQSLMRISYAVFCLKKKTI